jgi:hypothetical protein
LSSLLAPLSTELKKLSMPLGLGLLGGVEAGASMAKIIGGIECGADELRGSSSITTSSSESELKTESHS